MKKSWLVPSMVGVAFGLIVIVLVLPPRLQRHRWVEALKDENPAIRAAAIRGMPREDYEQLFIDALRDKNPDIRLLASQRLGGRGPRGTDRAWALIVVLKDDHAGVRREASWSLGVIGPDAWPALREALKHDNPRVRAGAALALSDAYQHKEVHPWPLQESQDIVPVLSKLLGDKDPEVRRNAEGAIGRLPVPH